MNNFSNINTFANHYQNNLEIPDAICKLFVFTSFSKFDRKISRMSLILKNTIKFKIGENDYIFNYNGKKYSFSVFSDYELQSFDKKILESKKRMEMSLSRTLKLACSMDLINPRVVIGTSIFGASKLLIMFYENGVDKVIDYAMNIVMDKDDYYSIFNYEELNVVDKFELYKIYFLLNKMGDYRNIYEYLLFTKEIINELAKKDEFKFLVKKYDSNGINKHNYLLFGDCSDALFFINKDFSLKYATLRKELDNFTENPAILTQHISYDKKTGKYKLRDRRFGFFTFDLLSDMCDNKAIKDKLLSKDRYQECHENAIMIANALDEEDKPYTYVVGGKIKINEIDYFYHSWVEIDNKNVIIDFNHNLVMRRDKYYKFFEAQPISKTKITQMQYIIQVLNDADFCLHTMDINYFGEELMKNLKKNEKILQKKKS